MQVTGLDPVSWTHSERRIRCPQWQRQRSPGDPCDPQKKERPEAADHSKSKTRNQRLIDFLRSTADIDPPDKTEQGDCRGTIIIAIGTQPV